MISVRFKPCGASIGRLLVVVSVGFGGVAWQAATAADPPARAASAEPDVSAARKAYLAALKAVKVDAVRKYAPAEWAKAQAAVKLAEAKTTPPAEAVAAYRRARQALRAAEVVRIERANSHMVGALFLHGMGKHEAARVCIEKALAIDGDSMVSLQLKQSIQAKLSGKEAPKPPSAPTTRPAMEAQKARLFGLDGVGRRVVFVTDRSGSMSPTFDVVRLEVLKSVALLSPDQEFSIVLFGDNKTMEGPGKMLVRATMDNKVAAAAFLSKITASGRTDALPALLRTFELLSPFDQPTGGGLVYLVTDGDFHGVTGGSTYRTPQGQVLRGNEAVLQWLRENNPKKHVRVNTLLLSHGHESGKAVLETIARDNGGAFKRVAAD